MHYNAKRKCQQWDIQKKEAKEVPRDDNQTVFAPTFKGV
jgi:hypothetical protein